MAVDFSRMRMKRSTIPGTVPTIPPVLDINTFLNTDIFPGELFYNMPDNKLYISDGTNINLIFTGSGPGGAPTLGQVLLNGNTSDGSNIIMDSGGQIFSGIGEILNLLSDTGVFAQANDTVYNQRLDMLPAAGTANLINEDIATGAFNSLILNSLNKEIFLTSFDPINATANITLNSSATPAADFGLSFPTGLTNRLQFNSGQIELIRTDGVNFNNRLEVLDTDMLFEAEDLLANRQANLELRHNLTYFSHFNNGLLSYIQAQDNTINIQTQDGTTLERIRLLSDFVGADVTDGTDISSVKITANDAEMQTLTPTIQNAVFVNQNFIRLRSDDFVNASEIQMYPTETFISTGGRLNITVIPAFADDAAALAGGLVQGDIYQTDGTGAAPLNAAGILMIVQ